MNLTLFLLINKGTMIEIISWDSDKTVLISKDENLLGSFKSNFHLSEDLEFYNRKLKIDHKTLIKKEFIKNFIFFRK